MAERVVQYLREDFERFWKLLERQIDVCPDTLWNKKAGGFVFSWQLMHTAACAEIFARAYAPSENSLWRKYPPEVMMLSKAPTQTLSKDEVKAAFLKVKAEADAFFDGLSSSSFTNLHEPMTKRLGKNTTLFQGALALIRHSSYHLGCLDAALRGSGAKGVY